MSVAIITGSCGLVGSEAVAYFDEQGFDIVGIDNDMRGVFFGLEASTNWVRKQLETQARSYSHFDIDIRDEDGINRLFERYGNSTRLVIHTAAQPSHDWSVRNPGVDFSVNANGTRVVLEATRLSAPEAVFIFTSTNKVYGDTPNRLPLVEMESRWELPESHPYHRGIDESMSVDQSMHSLFGASKVAADILVQEYGRYFQMRTACFRGGCLTGPNHSGTELHGFLAYLMKCTATGTPYTVYGYAGKQVRDNIHSTDLIRAMDEFFKNPRVAEVYNIGGSRFSNCSVLEAIRMSQEIAGRELHKSYTEANRKGDHIWWITDVSRFQAHYPGWHLTYDVPRILREIHEQSRVRWPVAR